MSAAKPLQAGRVTLRYEFAYDGGGVSKAYYEQRVSIVGGHGFTNRSIS